MRPPLTTSMTVPVTTPSSSLIFSMVPQARSYCALLGEDQAAFLVLLLEDEGLDLVADLDDLVGVDVVLDRQLARGDDALGLVADVEQDLVPVDLDDGALDDVAVVEVLDGRVDRGEEVFLGTDVVDRDLGGAVASVLPSCGRYSDSGRDVLVVRTAGPARRVGVPPMRDDERESLVGKPRRADGAPTGPVGSRSARPNILSAS